MGKKFQDQQVKEVIETAEKIQNTYYSGYDATNLQEAELVVSSSQFPYKDLFENMPDGCAYYKVLFDQEGTPINLEYMNVNSSYEKNIGRSRIELIGKRVTEVFPHLTEGSFQWIKTYMKVTLLRETVTFTQYFDHQDKWYSIFAYSPQRDYIIEISADITEIKGNEVKVDPYIAELAARNMDLTTSGFRYQGLLDHMHTIYEYHMVIVNENGQPVDLKSTEINLAFAMPTGLNSSDIVGRRLPSVIHGVDKEYWTAVLGDVALTGQAIILEKYLKNTDTWYKVTAYSPEEGHVASLFEDITKQKKEEIQRSDNQRQVALIEKATSLGTLAAGVAHRITQPLQALKIMADGMIYWYDKGKETSVEKVIENCRRISIQAGYINDTVEWMQDLVNEAWSDTLQEVDLNKMIKQALNMFPERLRVHSIKFRENICLISPTVWGDIKRLEQIIIIILVNAIETLACVDQVAKEIIMTTSCVGGKAVIEISNNGPAIADDIIKKMFEPLLPSSKSNDNLRMGLVIVKSIVDAHNGTIQVSSSNEQVIFRIEFPLYLQ